MAGKCSVSGGCVPGVSNLFANTVKLLKGISCSWWNGDLAEAVSGDD